MLEIEVVAKKRYLYNWETNRKTSVDSESGQERLNK